jgi:hypothetical protein
MQTCEDLNAEVILQNGVNRRMEATLLPVLDQSMEVRPTFDDGPCFERTR